MTGSATSLRDYLDSSPDVALVEIVEAAGSTPRDAAAWMLVSPAAIFGTIGGGQLEFMAIARAREMIRDAAPATDRLDIPLGPEIGQCCGGRVKIELALADDAARQSVLRRFDAAEATRAHVYVFGGGHVGHALADALALLPVRVSVVDTRQEALDGLNPAASAMVTAVPETIVRAAPPGAAYVVLTHDHALDFLIVAEALKRTDAAYVGMIGSKTKKETFRRWYLHEAGGTEPDFKRLVSPIGGADVRDKRPAVIASLAAAEIMRAVLAEPAAGPAT